MLKPTIYKTNISLSDLNRNYYDTLNITIARHPSETAERMMARIMAFCINAQEYLSFTKGISAAEEPDIWVHTLDDQVALWIEVGEPSVEKIKKASRIANKVKVYSFNSKSDAWWEQYKNKFNQLNASIYQFNWDTIQSLARMIERSIEFSVTITDRSAYVAGSAGECEVSWEALQDS